MNIEQMRKKCGMTQEELAKAVGVDRSAVAKWESGKTVPRTRFLRAIASVLKCTVDELMK